MNSDLVLRVARDLEPASHTQRLVMWRQGIFVRQDHLCRAVVTGIANLVDQSPIFVALLALPREQTRRRVVVIAIARDRRALVRLLLMRVVRVHK